MNKRTHTPTILAADCGRAGRGVCDRGGEQRRHGRGRRNTCRTAPL